MRFYIGFPHVCLEREKIRESDGFWREKLNEYFWVRQRQITFMVFLDFIVYLEGNSLILDCNFKKLLVFWRLICVAIRVLKGQSFFLGRFCFCWI